MVVRTAPKSDSRTHTPPLPCAPAPHPQDCCSMPVTTPEATATHLSPSELFQPGHRPQRETWLLGSSALWPSSRRGPCQLPQTLCVDGKGSQPPPHPESPFLQRPVSPFFLVFLVLVPSPPGTFFFMRRGFGGGMGLPRSPGNEGWGLDRP